MRAVAATIFNRAIHWIAIWLRQFSDTTLARCVIIADKVIARDDLRGWEGHVTVSNKVVMRVVNARVNHGNLHAVAGAGL